MIFQRGAWAEINLSAIAHNIKIARANLNSMTKLCAVVKADAYGHGAVCVAKEAARNGVDFFAVALLQEAVSLRDAGIEQPILVLGSLLPEMADICVEYNISHAIFDKERLYALNEAAIRQHTKAKIHIKIDTGMHRIGVNVRDAGDFAKLAASLPGIYIEGVFSHFATADTDDRQYSTYQFARFQEALKLIQSEGVYVPIKHMANSAALMEFQEYQLDMVRMGITMYGLYPDHMSELYKNLKPAMKVKTRVSFVKTLKVGETIGYGRSFTTTRTSIIATVPIGYADGISRRLSNKGYMVINGKYAPIVGKVCMDQIMLDVTDIPNVSLGSEVTVFGGSELPVGDVAKLTDTISYEIVSCIGSRIIRNYHR